MKSKIEHHEPEENVNAEIPKPLRSDELRRFFSLWGRRFLLSL